MTRGKMTPAQILTCFYCGQERIFTAKEAKPVPQYLAEKWAREAGWTKTKSGWAHKRCVDRNKAK